MTNKKIKKPISRPTKLNKLSKKALKLIRLKSFKSVYFVFSLILLAGSTIYWAILGAKVQLTNSDNLVVPYLFKTARTFHDATFPGQHTFLIKWPIFYLIKLFGFSDKSYISFTVLLVLITVFGFAYLLYFIERRKLVIGTILLALASVMLLIPASPYAGGILPTNLAMLNTRNIEYLIYIVSLVLIIKAKKLIDWRYGLAIVCLTLLVASDKLFLGVGLIAAVVLIVVTTLAKKWKLVNLSVYWLIGQVVAGVLAILLLDVISATHLTHISNQANLSIYGSSPVHSAVLGAIYGLFGILTNFGANPAFDATVLKHIPGNGFDRLFGISGLSYIINLVFLISLIVLIVRFVYVKLGQKTNQNHKEISAVSLAMMIIASAVSVVLLFVGSNHYYAVDARYLALVFFAGFITLVVFSRQKLWATNWLIGVGLVLVLSIALGFFGATNNYNDEKKALSEVNNRNSDIASIIKIHPTDTLVGDYWRVIPVLQKTGEGSSVMPLASCTQPRVNFNSNSWQLNLADHSFTYLLSYDQKLTDFPSCSLKQVVSVYGRPNASTLIAGSQSNPEEQLLFYDHGINNSTPTTPQPAEGPSTVLPITLDQQPYTNCSDPSIMPIVAHQDDDLLFMNPDILNAIKKGFCVRTVYLTAGDDGRSNFYWLSRQRGAEAAYSQMTGDTNIWVSRIVQIEPNEYATIANPRGNSKISLIFINLPDGNMKGQGFPTNNSQSLSKLTSHAISTITSVDSQSTYTLSQLTNALNLLMSTYNPVEIYTQSGYAGSIYQDHSDHNTVSLVVKQAYAKFEQIQYANLVTIPLSFYLGYPTHSLADNISDGDLKQKEAAFFAYAKYDPGACASIQLCSGTAYLPYLEREYKYPY